MNFSILKQEFGNLSDMLSSTHDNTSYEGLPKTFFDISPGELSQKTSRSGFSHTYESTFQTHRDTSDKAIFHEQNITQKDRNLPVNKDDLKRL